MKRIKEFDLARAIAIFLMILVHAEYAIYNYNNELFGKVVDYLGSPFAAPTFMFILGANIIISKHNSAKELLLRGIDLFIMSIVFNIICHALPFFIIDYTNHTMNYVSNSLHWIFAVDILTFAGLAFMFFALVKKFNINKYLLIFIALMCSVLSMILTRNFPIEFNNNYVLASLTSLFYNSSITGYFSFLSWIIFPISGYVFMDFYKKVKEKDQDKFYLKVGIPCFIILIIMLIFQKNAAFGKPIIDFNDEYSYYRMLPYGAIMTVAFCISWLTVLHFVVKKIPDKLYKHILRLSKNITTIYYIQWFILNYFFVLLSNNTFFVNEIGLIICAIIILLASDFLAFIYLNKLQEKKLILKK